MTEQCDHAQALAGSISQAISQASFLAGRETSGTGQLKALVFSPPARRANPAAELPARGAWNWCRIRQERQKWLLTAKRAVVITGNRSIGRATVAEEKGMIKSNGDNQEL